MPASRAGSWRIWFDDQCEVCQAGVAWLGRLDREHRVETIPLGRLLGAEEQASRAGGLPPGVEVDDLLRHLHARAPDGSVLVGAAAVAALARLFPATAWVGWLAQRRGLATLAERAYGWIAANRYSLSRCRGGACRASRVDLMKQRSAWRAFQVCRTLGWTGVAPLAVALYARRLCRQAAAWRHTRGRAVWLLDGRLSIHFLGGGLSATVPILFGELFTMLRYRSLVVDPGGSRMRRSAKRHLEQLRREVRITDIALTHAHEEHCGNLDLAARVTGARLHVHPRAARLVTTPVRLPRMRAWVIGQPLPVASPLEPLREAIPLGDATVQILETPGHSDDHVSLYAPADRLLLAGDGFMGTYFSSPNDDVDHRRWIESLERLLALDVDIMVEAHGHVHTLREDVLGDLERQGAGVIASRRHPHELMREKLRFLRWMGEQIDLGRADGLPARGIRGTVFPWTQRWSYESAVSDTVAAVVSAGGFGRHKLVRSFQTAAGGGATRLPAVYELSWRVWRGPDGDS